MKKKVFNYKDLIIIVTLTSFIMCFLGGLLVYKHLEEGNYNILNTDKMKEFLSAYEDLYTNYYEELSSEDLIDGAIAGMYAKTGDPYTSHLDGNNSNSLNKSLEGKYKGIGVILLEKESKQLEISKVLDSSPAKEAGIKAGDIITAIDLEDVTNYDSIELSKIIANHASDTVNLTINRNGEILSFDVKIKYIYEPVTTESTINYNNKKIGYLQLSIFSENAYEQFNNSLKKLEKSNIDSLIIDLRNNTGGYLDIAKSISELFLKKNKVVYSVAGKKTTNTVKDSTEESRNYKIDILMNHSSASASEVLAAALKYSYNAKIVGKTSYGKGKIQEKNSLSDGTIIKYTTAKWLTPNGDCVDKVGLVPDINIELNSETYDYNDLLTDNQIVSALDDLTK